VVNTIANGAYITTACQFAGISSTSYATWRQRGETEMERVRALGENPDEILRSVAYDDGGRSLTTEALMNLDAPAPFTDDEWNYVVFLLHTERANASAEIRNLTIIQNAASDGQWQAGAWILERKHPERWGRRERINLEGPQNGSPVQVASVSVDELEQKLAALREQEGG
jgi:hypothetical protein